MATLFENYMNKVRSMDEMREHPFDSENSVDALKERIQQLVIELKQHIPSLEQRVFAHQSGGNMWRIVVKNNQGTEYPELIFGYFRERFGYDIMKSYDDDPIDSGMIDENEDELDYMIKIINKFDEYTNKVR